MNAERRPAGNRAASEMVTATTTTTVRQTCSRCDEPAAAAVCTGWCKTLTLAELVAFGAAFGDVCACVWYDRLERGRAS